MGDQPLPPIGEKWRFALSLAQEVIGWWPKHRAVRNADAERAPRQKDTDTGAQDSITTWKWIRYPFVYINAIAS